MLKPAAPVVRSVPAPEFGVLVMAHGGSGDWNARVEDAVEPLRASFPVTIAFGMADPEAMQAGIDRLERQGVERIGVVRLFVSGESFRHRTEYLLGLRPDPPAASPHYPAGPTGGANCRCGGSPLEPLRHRSEIRMSDTGLAASEQVGDIVVERALALSRDPERETVLLLAHGMGAPAANGRLVADLERVADRLRAAAPFAGVAVETLREDWPEARRAAETRIRRRIEAAAEQGEALVIPFRLHGFGPYAQVLDGLRYRPDTLGLLPHPGITRWIVGQAEQLQRTDPARR